MKPVQHNAIMQKAKIFFRHVNRVETIPKELHKKALFLNETVQKQNRSVGDVNRLRKAVFFKKEKTTSSGSATNELRTAKSFNYCVVSKKKKEPLFWDMYTG